MPLLWLVHDFESLMATSEFYDVDDEEIMYQVQVYDPTNGNVLWHSRISTRSLGTSDLSVAERWGVAQFRAYSMRYAGPWRIRVVGDEADQWEANRAYGEAFAEYRREALAEYGPKRRKLAHRADLLINKVEVKGATVRNSGTFTVEFDAVAEEL